ncbi:MAG: AMP-binding protein [Bacillota bacterium]
MNIWSKIADTFAQSRETIIYKYEETALSFEQLDLFSNQVAFIFQKNGVKKGDHIGFINSDPMHTIISYCACFKLGAVSVPLEEDAWFRETWNDQKTTYKINYLVSSQKLLSYSDLEKITNDTINGQINKIFLFSSKNREELSSIFCEITPENLNSDKNNYIKGTVYGEDIAFIFSTSGSTGVPKGVMLSHNNVTFFMNWAKSEYNITSQDTLLCHAPLYSDVTLFSLFCSVAAGGRCIIIPTSFRWNPSKVIEYVQEHQITVIQLVSSMVRVISNQFSDHKLSHVRVLISTGERFFSLESLSKLYDMFENVTIYNVYGSTEANDIFSFNVPREINIEEDMPIGKPFNHVEVLIMNEDGIPCKKGEVGELLVKTPTMMQGYIGNDIQQPFVKHGNEVFLKTGDLLAQSGSLYYYMGRKDRMIKINGQRVFPQIVEQVLTLMPKISEVAVLSEDIGGRTTLIAFIYANDFVDSIEIRAFCSEKLPSHYIPNKYIRVDHPLPKKTNGKVDYTGLLKRLQL